MRIPLRWLREYVDVDVPAEVLAARLGISTCEIVAIERFGPSTDAGNLDRLRAGRLVDLAAHSHGEALTRCLVDVGEGPPREIVCGADNLELGGSFAVGLPGAELPGGTVERRGIRGIESNGMLLSEREIGIGTDHSGVLALPGAAPGESLASLLGLGDEVLEIEVTGNRPDLLSVYGVAREVAVLFDSRLRPLTATERKPRGDTVDVRVEDVEACPVYIARLFDGVRTAPSPPWLRARLLASGVRPISNIVDATNYVMLAVGSPLHAFDADTIRDCRVVVRRASEAESITTLDGTQRRLSSSDLVIADAEHPIAVAGIMGGADSEVRDETHHVLLEAANFNPIWILRSSHRLQLRTEASNRWEKGVDPWLAALAADFATQLILESSDARWTADAEVAAALPPPPVARLRTERTDMVLGATVAQERQREILEGLGFAVSEDWTVTTPSWRARDVTREIDLIEEIARVELDSIPFRLPRREAMFGQLTDQQRVIRALQDVLVASGLQEVYTPSLVPSDHDPHAMVLPEPASQDQSTLRTTLLPSLVRVAEHNLNIGNPRVELFEIARVYLPSGGQLPDEHYRVSAIVHDDFFRIKGIVEAVHHHLHAPVRFDRGNHFALHPGKTARVPAGSVGELHPSLLPGTWAAFELDVPTLVAASDAVVTYRDLITYPAVKEDLAFSLPDDVAAGEIMDAAREAAGDELQEIRVFDVYSGDQLPPGRRSLAFSLVYQSPSRTLNDADASRLRGRIVETLEARFDAQLRA